MNTITSSSRTDLKAFSFSCILWLLGWSVSPAPAAQELRGGDGRDSFTEARLRMVERDLRGRGIKDERVLAIMGSVPRHAFVAEKLRSSAYEDRPLPIGEGQTISQPYIVAVMTELLALKESDRVLEIGTGSGYQTAVLARLASEVFTVEIVPTLGERANKVLAQLGFTNVQLKIGDGFFGWKEKGPFDAILMTAAAPNVPEPLWRQLREDGRLVMPLGDEGQTQKLIRVRKVAGKQVVEEITEVAFVPLTGAIRKERR